ncbi:MAG: T9SS type A sorting domain-containing protein [Burkholderiales bacterium]|nr:T9SS type A sorting domain-containing protein [Flavobacterium sp.]
MKKNTLLTILLVCSHSFSQIINTAPYILTVDQLKQWTSNGATASTNLIATIPLAPRFTNTATQFNPALTNNMKIAYLPDGMNNFGNYFGEQPQFNLYNFTHWAYLDKLVWFGGTASQTIQLPSSPWTNAAHKNGVKVFGNVFFAPTAFGGATATLTSFLEQDLNGNFVAIPKMIAIMQYYNFDGWFINQETATNSTTAALMYAFVRDLTSQAEAIGKEVMWYDAMILNGNVGWQNRLNTNNSVFLQRDEDANTVNGFEQKVSSSIFINFFWSSAVFPNASRTRANAIGRSSFEVFTGADIWPGRNQGNFETNGNTFMTNLHENAVTPYTSLGLFAPNCVYNNSVYTNFNNDPADYATFYDAENRLFSGDDNNPASVDATGFKGLCNWIPEATVINDYFFSTNFCTGHGLKKFANGLEVSNSPWHDMNQQAMLPTWQWGFESTGSLNAAWDFDVAYEGGNSLKVSGNLTAGNAVDLMLYKTSIYLSSNGSIYPPQFELLLKTNVALPAAGMKLLVVFSDEPTQKYEFPLTAASASNGWQRYFGNLAGFQTREVSKLGFRFLSDEAIPDYQVNIGTFAFGNSVLTTQSMEKDKTFVTVSYPINYASAIHFTLNWPDTKQVDYILYDLKGKAIKTNTIKINGITNYSLDTNGLASGTYAVKFTDQQNHTEVRKIIIK